KCRPLAPRRPFLPLQSIRKLLRSPSRRRIHLPLGPFRFLPIRRRPQHPQPRQFLQRIVNLRPRNPRPVLHLSPHQLRIRLIPMHRPLRQQTQQHQIRRRQPRTVLLFPLLHSVLPLRLCVNLSSGFLCLVSSFFARSTTTTGISPPPISDPSPAPPPPPTCPARHCPA